MSKSRLETTWEARLRMAEYLRAVGAELFAMGVMVKGNAFAKHHPQGELEVAANMLLGQQPDAAKREITEIIEKLHRVLESP